MLSKEIIIFLETSCGEITLESKNLYGFFSAVLEQSPFYLSALTYNYNVEMDNLNFENVYVLNLTKNNFLNQVKAIIDFIQEFSPQAIFFPANFSSKDLIPKISAELHLPFFLNILNTEFTETNLYFYQNGYYGKTTLVLKTNLNQTILAELELNEKFTFKNLKNQNQPQIINLTQKIEKNIFASEPNWIKTILDTPENRDLLSAEVVVGIGRGVKKEVFPLVYELADLLNAALGGSKPVIEEKLLPSEKQIGQTGKDLRAKIYFALGISGQIQHLQGLEKVKKIVAVNQDATAPIFKYADEGVVGKVEEIVPELIKKIKGKN